MARTYTPKRRYPVKDPAERLTRFRALDSAARDALRLRATAHYPLEEGVSMTTNEGATVTTEKLSDAEREAREDHLTPSMTLVMLRLGRVGIHTCSLAMWDDSEFIDVQLSSEDEGLVLGLAARFDRLMTSAVPAATSSPVVLPAPAPAPAPAPSRATTHSRNSISKPLWAFIFTIVGAVIAGGILKALGWV